jgi:hypothetical protein
MLKRLLQLYQARARALDLSGDVGAGAKKEMRSSKKRVR